MNKIPILLMLPIGTEENKPEFGLAKKIPENFFSISGLKKPDTC